MPEFSQAATIKLNLFCTMMELHTLHCMCWFFAIDAWKGKRIVKPDFAVFFNDVLWFDGCSQTTGLKQKVAKLYWVIRKTKKWSEFFHLFRSIIFLKKYGENFKELKIQKKNNHQMNPIHFSLFVKNIVLNLHIRSMSLNVTIEQVACGFSIAQKQQNNVICMKKTRNCQTTYWCENRRFIFWQINFMVELKLCLCSMFLN